MTNRDTENMFSALERLALKRLSEEDIYGLEDSEIVNLERRLEGVEGFDTAKEGIRKHREQIDKAKWGASYVNNLPDSAFFHIEPGGTKDDNGLTTPRELRHLPYKDDKGNIDLPHLRNALSRLSQTDIPSKVKEDIESKAKKLLESVRKSFLVFVESEESPLEKARQELLVGPVSNVFDTLYLDGLGLTRDDVTLCVTKDFDPVRYRDSIVIALGRDAGEDLACIADFVLPHPEAVRKYGNSGEVGRKITKLRKTLDNKCDMLYNAICKLNIIACNGEGSESNSPIEIAKALPEKQIVYGVVLDPYGANGTQADGHNDWTPPAEIEKTAHDYMKHAREVKLQHRDSANAKVVESWVEQYPTTEDYTNAMLGMSHNVGRRQFGSDVIHSGSWCLGVELGDKEWELYKAGEITAFSPGGFGAREPLNTIDMPEVTFVDIR